MWISPDSVKATPNIPDVEGLVFLPDPYLHNGVYYYQAPIRPKPQIKIVKPKVGYCSCVLYAKAITGYREVVGYAKNWPKNSETPQVGGVIITNESYAGHVGVITQVQEDSITITEANYRKCQVTERTISITSTVIKGYWN